MQRAVYAFYFFFFNDTATTEIYTLSLHDALPISHRRVAGPHGHTDARHQQARIQRSEEHTSELQSQSNLVCRLLLEKKKKKRDQWTLPIHTIGRAHYTAVSTPWRTDYDGPDALRR